MNDLIVFVFLGRKLPNYARASLRLAKTHSGLKVVLLGNQSVAGKVRGTGASFIPVESFYRPELFAKAESNITLSKNFRKGFWVRSLERLFVLEQFMASRNLNEVLHAELDQVLFGVDDLLHKLRALSKTGVFFPFHSADKAVASVFYCNSLVALRSLLDEATNGPVFSNEMQLLVRWAAKFPLYSIALPTLSSPNSATEIAESPEGEHLRTISSAEIDGVVDAAEIGLWVGGRDPRNLGRLERPSTKFLYATSKASLKPEYLRALIFDLVADDRLEVQEPGHGDRIRLYNLHLHSKIHDWLWRRNQGLNFLILKANQPGAITIPGTRATQIFALLAFGVKNRLFLMLRAVNYIGTVITGGPARWNRELSETRGKWAAKALEHGKLRFAAAISRRVRKKKILETIASYQNRPDFIADNFFEGQTVALIGPGFSGSTAKTLGNYDRIVAIGYTGHGSNALDGHLLWSASFIAKWHAQDICGTLRSSLDQLSGIRLVMRNDVTDAESSLLRPHLRTSFFSTEPCDAVFVDVVPNLGPQVIVWLLAQRPRKLHISHMDLMTDPRRPGSYSSSKKTLNYGSFWEYPKETMRRSFSQFHNPFTHFSFFKSLSKLPTVDFSKQLHHLISAGIGEYRRKIGSLYYD